jgi:uncharacterized protein YndB with AHSA1/START domain
MEYGSIEREIFIAASPEVVFDVVSTAEHLAEWWPDEARFDSTPGSEGSIAFGDPDAGGVVQAFSVVEVESPRKFSFRWTHTAGDVAAEGNSLLVTFELAPSGDGTLLTMTETGFREMGWEAAVLEAQYQDHIVGWDHFLPRLAPYALRLAARS